MKTPQRFYKLLFDAVIETSIEIFTSSTYADKAIGKCLKQHSKWGSRDRAFVAQHTYDMVRWYRLLAFLVDANPQPTRADWWHMLGALRWIQEQELPDWGEFKNLNINMLNKRFAEASSKPEIKQSVPDWLYELGQNELGGKWLNELEALNKQAQLYLRVNSLRVQPNKLIADLAKEGVLAFQDNRFSDALVIPKRVNVFGTQAFKNGWFEVQDIASQQVAQFMQLKAGMRVIDACAGAGGKTLHMAAIMGNKGKIVAMDTEQWKLDELRRRAARSGADTIEIYLLSSDGFAVPSKYKHTADRVLLDVPCSGLGVLRRNPDAKWKLNPDFINRMRNTQEQILTNYSQMVKPGGKLIYATCSIMPGENEQQVERFLKVNNQFILEDQFHTYPSQNMDGFFMARLTFNT
jgi:16S rRNA (cytosine967-C5)-methyltransferase